MVGDLTLFYHFFICPDDRGLFWNWWLDEQATLMKNSNMQNLMCCITMPRFWNTIYGHPICEDGTRNQISLENKVIEYINTKYNFLNILDIRDTGDLNIYEGSTLIKLWEFSKNNPNEYVGYIHTKGVMSLGVNTSLWRQYLNKKFITEWKDRYIEVLKGYDVTAVIDKQCDDTVISGNFFYASTNYIASLEKPLYYDRYKYEKWILSGNPKLNIIKNTNVDHFMQMYIEEN